MKQLLVFLLVMFALASITAVGVKLPEPFNAFVIVVGYILALIVAGSVAKQHDWI